MVAPRLSGFLLCVLLAACGKKDGTDSTKKPEAPPVKVTLVTAALGETPQQVVLTGMVAADQRAEVTADTQGKVIDVMVVRGKRVKLGDPTVRLDVQTAALGVREAQANLASARAQRALAEEECKRTKDLLAKGAITKSEYDRQITQCTAALEQVSAAEARTAMMAKSVRDGIVRAPFDGVVADKAVTPGEWVAPGRALFTLVDDDPLRIELSVPEAAVRAIRMDQKVDLVSVANPDQRYVAKVTRIGAEIGRTRSLIVEATIEKPVASAEKRIPTCDEPASVKPKAAAVAVTEVATPPMTLVPGMFAEANLTVGTQSLVVLPRTALIRRGKTCHAYVAINGELVDRIVQVGPAPAPDKVSIVQGVVTGEKVVAKVTDQIIDGLRVVE
jgi:membrane fusion protein, multidrug efflux system